MWEENLDANGRQNKLEPKEQPGIFIFSHEPQPWVTGDLCLGAAHTPHPSIREKEAGDPMGAARAAGQALLPSDKVDQQVTRRECGDPWHPTLTFSVRWLPLCF